jgi:hypothetical protein
VEGKLKIILISAILLVLGLHANHVLFYSVLFKINRQGLEESVCEKKTPTCRACCYLNKQIQEDNPENKQALPQKDKKNNEQNIQEYLVSRTVFNSAKCNLYSTFSLSDSSILFQYSSEIFRPPENLS